MTIVRPTGIYGPGDRRLLKLFGGVARGRFPMLGSGRIYYHLTYIDDLVEGFRLCGEHPAAANRTYILAGGEVTTLNELVALVAAVAGTKPPRVHLPVWPVWIAGAACELLCAPFGIEPPLYRRRVDFYTKSRAFDITRARTGNRVRPEGRVERGRCSDTRVVPGEPVDLKHKALTRTRPTRPDHERFGRLLVRRFDGHRRFPRLFGGSRPSSSATLKFRDRLSRGSRDVPARPDQKRIPDMKPVGLSPERRTSNPELRTRNPS